MNTTSKSLISGLSYALDIAEGNYLSHAKHVTYTALLLGNRFEGVDPSNLYFASLIHDVGAGLTYGEKEHSITGSEIISQLPLSPYISKIILYHHEAYDGSGPFGLSGDEIPMESQIIYAANLIDYHLKGKFAADYTEKIALVEWIDKLAGKLSPDIIDELQRLVSKPFFLLEYYDDDIDIIVDRYAKGIEATVLTNADIIKYSEVFSSIIDLRNPFTNHHSLGIAEIARQIAESMAFTVEERDQLYISALLHDVGKLAVDNAIINKPGRLTDEERYEIETHTYYTRWILAKIDGFDQITEWASNHHEKINGKGYPYGKSGSQLDSFSRIIAIADVYQALTEPRPYRPPMNMDKVYGILRSMADANELDKELLDLMIERKIL